MGRTGAHGEPLDILVVGEMVVDSISSEKTDRLRNAATFHRRLGVAAAASPEERP